MIKEIKSNHTSTKYGRYIKHAIIFIVISVMSIVIVKFMFDWNILFFKIILPATILFIFLFSIIVRKNIRFKSFFTSKYNLLTGKYRSKYEFEFSKELLFHKIIEVLQESGFNVRHTDKNTGDILATSGLTWTSWGENIYIELTEQDGITIMEFCSSSIFGIYTWGKNEDNYYKLLNKFEESLTI
jgi:hypothetical protein